jgi:hypothetical protein
MPIKKDEKGGGTNADGTRSLKYCSLCYQDGKFLRPDFTAKQMQELVKSKMKEMGIPGFLVPFFTRGIPKLERWQE